MKAAQLPIESRKRTRCCKTASIQSKSTPKHLTGRENELAQHPLAEVFGFPLSTSEEAQRYRRLRLCPFNNRVPNCTKDKVNDPLGVCSIYDGSDIAITCPVRFRQNWVIAEDAANFFFPKGMKWTSLIEVRLNDRDGLSAGNIDVVLVSYNDQGRVTDFGALEVQGVYISENVRRPFEHYMQDQISGHRIRQHR